MTKKQIEARIKKLSDTRELVAELLGRGSWTNCGFEQRHRLHVRFKGREDDLAYALAQIAVGDVGYEERPFSGLIASRAQTALAFLTLHR